MTNYVFESELPFIGDREDLSGDFQAGSAEHARCGDGGESAQFANHVSEKPFGLDAVYFRHGQEESMFCGACKTALLQKWVSSGADGP